MPTVFFKSFLEFNGANLVSILTFDSNSLKALLDDKHSEHFDNKFPLFYTNKISKTNNIERFYYRSAIDTALKNNQLRAVQAIIDYIVKYQNNYTSCSLFQTNMIQLIEGDISIKDLLDSEIFSF